MFSTTIGNKYATQNTKTMREKTSEKVQRPLVASNAFEAVREDRTYLTPLMREKNTQFSGANFNAKSVVGKLPPLSIVKVLQKRFGYVHWHTFSVNKKRRILKNHVEKIYAFIQQFYDKYENGFTINKVLADYNLSWKGTRIQQTIKTKNQRLREEMQIMAFILTHKKVNMSLVPVLNQQLIARNIPLKKWGQLNTKQQAAYYKTGLADAIYADIQKYYDTHRGGFHESKLLNDFHLYKSHDGFYRFRSNVKLTPTMRIVASVLIHNSRGQQEYRVRRENYFADKAWKWLKRHYLAAKPVNKPVLSPALEHVKRQVMHVHGIKEYKSTFGGNKVFYALDVENINPKAYTGDPKAYQRKERRAKMGLEQKDKTYFGGQRQLEEEVRIKADREKERQRREAERRKARQKVQNKNNKWDEARNIFIKGGKQLDKVLQKDGKKISFKADGLFPVYGVLNFGCYLQLEAERSGNDTKLHGRGGIILAIGKAKTFSIGLKLGLYVEAVGSSATHAMELIQWEIYQSLRAKAAQLRQTYAEHYKKYKKVYMYSTGTPKVMGTQAGLLSYNMFAGQIDSFCNYMWGGDEGSKASADNWANYVKASLRKPSNNHYVEYGANINVYVDAKIKDIEGKAELDWLHGNRIDKETIDKKKKTNIDTLVFKVGIKPPSSLTVPFQFEGSAKYIRRFGEPYHFEFAGVIRIGWSSNDMVNIVGTSVLHTLNAFGGFLKPESLGSVLGNTMYEHAAFTANMTKTRKMLDDKVNTKIDKKYGASLKELLLKQKGLRKESEEEIEKKLKKLNTALAGQKGFSTGDSIYIPIKFTIMKNKEFINQFEFFVGRAEKIGIDVNVINVGLEVVAPYTRKFKF